MGGSWWGKPDSPRWARWKQAHGPSPCLLPAGGGGGGAPPAGLWLRLHVGLRPRTFPCPLLLHPRNVLELIEFFEEEDRLPGL